MKKEYIIIMVLSLLVVGLSSFIVYDKFLLDKDEIIIDDNDEEKVANTSEYIFDTAYGVVKINADNALAARGSAGASSTIFYLKNGNLYLYVYDGEDELYIENVHNIYYESDMSEQITVKLMVNAVIKKESTYLKCVK